MSTRDVSNWYYDRGYSAGYNQGRNDAIEEFINRVFSLRIYDNDLNLSDLELVAEQMKDSKK